MRTWLGGLAVAALTSAACNAVTGAEDIRFSDDDDGDDASAQTGSSGQTGGSTLAGGTNGSGGQLASSGAGGSFATATSSGVGAGPTECDYPTGPYGVGQGQTVPPTLSWQGYAPGASAASTISAQDFFDCDGSRGIDAVIIDTSQYG